MASAHIAGSWRTGRQERCQACKHFERICMAHLELFFRNPYQRQQSLDVPIHRDFEELSTCADQGCHLCRCWANALLAECSSVSIQRSLVASKAVIVATSPITLASPIRTGVADAREAHFFKISSTVQATMRLGGVSEAEFAVLTTANSFKKTIEWATELLSACHSEHALCEEMSLTDQAPTRLLKVHNPDLVALVDSSDVQSPLRYAALSYCWGGIQETMLTEHTQQELKGGVDPARFSQTIQDALFVCQLLKIEYLWVDALCILQDGDGSDWHREALAMNKVYGGAYLTLSICSAASASEGFLHDQHQPRPVDARSCGIIGKEETAMLPVHLRKTLAHARTETPLAKRGWIFQEELLSPRILYWTEQGLFWSCCTLKDAQNGTSQKDELFPQLIPPTVMDAQEFRTHPDPLFLWDDMVSSFSTRDFTLHDDRLPAVSGLAALIEQATGEEYLLGFWKSRLPAQLLWIVTGPMECRSVLKGAPSYGPPSWSWASVEPARQIVMPKQSSSKARFVRAVRHELHLCGRARLLTEGLSPLWAYPEEVGSTVVGPRFPMLEHQPSVWAIDHDRRRILVCLDWRRPVIIQLDGDIPVEDFFDELLCFEINYIGFLLLKPVSREGAMPQTYQRIGCCQVHRERKLFEGAEEIAVVVQ